MRSQWDAINLAGSSPARCDSCSSHRWLRGFLAVGGACNHSSRQLVLLSLSSRPMQRESVAAPACLSLRNTTTFPRSYSVRPATMMFVDFHTRQPLSMANGLLPSNLKLWINVVGPHAIHSNDSYPRSIPLQRIWVCLKAGRPPKQGASVYACLCYKVLAGSPCFNTHSYDSCH